MLTIPPSLMTYVLASHTSTYRLAGLYFFNIIQWLTLKKKLIDISWYLQTTIFVKWRHLELMEVGSCRNWKLQAAKSLFYLVTFDWKCVYGIKYTYIQIFHFHALGWVALRVCQHQHQPRSPGAQLGKFDSTGGLHLDRAKLWVQGKYYTKNLTVHSFMALLFWLRKQPYKSLCPRRTQKDPEGPRRTFFQKILIFVKTYC